MPDIIFSPGSSSRAWSFWSVDEPRAVVLIIHGMLEHMGRYDAYARHLNQRGIFVCGLDHMGHGRSAYKAEDLGYFNEGWHRLIGDVEALRCYVQSLHPEVPFFYLGHSMGSFILRALLAIPDLPASGAIIMGTAQMPGLLTSFGTLLAEGVAKFMGPRHRNRFLNHLSTGRHKNDFAQPYAWLSRDPAVQKSYARDPYCQFVPTTAMQENVYRLLNYVSRPKTIRQIPKRLPLLVLAGSQDPVGNFGLAVLSFYRILVASGHEEATLKLYPQARHELLNESSRKQVYDDIDHWIDLQLSP